MTNDSTSTEEEEEERGWQRPTTTTTQTFHAHFDCFSGAAGDMMLAACLDAAGDAEQSERLLQHVTNCLEQGMPELKGEFGLETKIVWRGGMGSIAGRHVNVTSRYHHQAAPVPEKKVSDGQGHDHGHGHGHDHSRRDQDTEPSTDYSVLEADTDHSHGHEHGYGHGHSHSNSNSSSKAIEKSEEDSHSHSHSSHDHSKSTEKDSHNHHSDTTKSGEDGHSHSHSHSSSHPDTTTTTVEQHTDKQQSLPTKDTSNDGHNHAHGHSHGHSHYHSPGAADSHNKKGPLRNLPEIRKMLQEAPDQFIPPWVRDTAIAAFTELAQAEAMTHGAASMDAVHFHEVGAVDSIVDTVGTLIALYNLGVSTSVSCSRLPVGEGTVWTDHGLLPVPAPATLRILVGMPLCQVS